MWSRARGMVGICVFFLVSCVALAEWYEELPPGVTRSEIAAVAGAPTTVSEGDDLYYLEQGFLVLSYRGDRLQKCLHHYPGDGALYQHLYSLEEDPLTQKHIVERLTYIKEGLFILRPQFSGPQVYTALHPGCKCYRLDDGYLTISELLPLLGANGFYVNHSQEVVRYTNNGNREVLYNAKDNWADLKPDYLTDAQLAKREASLKQIESSPNLTESLEKLFGEPDGGMGSSIMYILYYSKDGFICVSYGELVVFNELEYRKNGASQFEAPVEDEPFSWHTSEVTVSEDTLDVVPSINIDLSEVENLALELQEKRKKAQEKKAEEQKKSLAAAKERSRKQSQLSASRKRDYLKYCEVNNIEFSESGKRSREKYAAKSSSRSEEQKNRTFYHYKKDTDGTILCCRVYYIDY